MHRAVQSVINQSFLNWELIIIDDGSKDNTKDVVEQFKDTRIKYHYQKNTERSQARNNGIDFSKGSYICFLDSDDEYCNNHLSVFYSFINLNQNPVGLFFSNPIPPISQQNLAQQHAVSPARAPPPHPPARRRAD
jgi:glycosyltransferase involved in cell wall biosynthesis